MTSPWLPYYRPRPGARLRLFCLPHAGGGASAFRTWPEHLPAGIDVCAVQFPGRENRLSERAFRRIDGLVDALADALRPRLDRPFAFFGHSMGGRVAFELARRLRNQDGLRPLHMFVSAARAPQIPRPEDPIHEMDEADFVERLRQLGSIPEPVLQDAELRALFVPVLRADFEIVETYRYRPGEPLSCPITAFGGVHDSSVRREHLEAWREQTNRAFALRILPGDHLFLQSQRSALLQALSAVLAPVVTQLEHGAGHEDR